MRAGAINRRSGSWSPSRRSPSPACSGAAHCAEPAPRGRRIRGPPIASDESQPFVEVKAMELDPAEVTERLRGTLSDLLGVRVVEASKERVVAELRIRDEIRTVGGALHGGTLMALADTIGATATALNLPPGAGTTTLESKTNFFAAG